MTVEDNDSRKIKDAVKRYYQQALTEAEQIAAGKQAPDMGVASEMAGYTPGQLKTLPAGLAVTSFGCGNPVAMLPVQEGQTVLDLGSGAGMDLILAAARVGASGHVIGVDMTPVMIAKAKENIRRAGLTNIEVRQGEMENLPVEDNSVDWVISNCVINLSPDKKKVFAEIARVLKPGGGMVVSDIVTLGGLPDDIKSDMAAWSACLGGAMPEADYLACAEAAGLVDVRVTEKLVYDKSQLIASGSSCCSSSSCGPSMEVSGRLAGLIASVKVAARKPGGREENV
ncbi:MAG: arsenite methyltransferase, partial [candidate division Zixibacteria bacterium]|nr:arsenite methyltransferase [candidate division Zixibacteria bacterium]